MSRLRNRHLRSSFSPKKCTKSIVGKMTEILPDLWLGDAHTALDEHFLAQAGVNIVINCTADIEFIKIAPSQNTKITFKRLQNIDVNTLNQVTKYIHEQLGRNQVVLVHCKNGRFRAPAVVCAYLVRYGEMPANTAVKQLQSKHPGALRELNDYTQHLYSLEKLYIRNTF